MLEIIKYQLKGRKYPLALLLGIFAIVNLAAWLFMIKSLIFGESSPTAALAFWIPVSIAVTVITSIVTFFLCGSGHVNDLLYRNTSYLMLTIPRRGWEILGGRFIAGLIEYLAIAISAFVILSVHIALGVSFANPDGMGFAGILLALWSQIFVVNFLPTLLVLLLALCVFTSAGMSLAFAAVASRSFIKNRGIATAITIAIFVFVSHKTATFGSFLSEKLNWFLRIPFSMDGMAFGGTMSGARFGSHIGSAYAQPGLRELTIPIAPFLCFLALALALFAAASWLMEKKVEL